MKKESLPGIMTGGIEQVPARHRINLYGRSWKDCFSRKYWLHMPWEVMFMEQCV